MQCRLEPVCTSWSRNSDSFPGMVHKGSISTSWKQSGTMCRSFYATITAIPVFLLRMQSSTVLGRNRVQTVSFTVPCETGVLVLVHILSIGWSNGIYILHPCCLNVQRARKISNRLPETTGSLKQQTPWSCSVHSPNRVSCPPYS